MKRAVIVTVLFFLAPVCDQVRADIDHYRNVATYGSDARECDGKDVGRTQVSCKYIEIGLVDGYLSERDRQDPRWPDIMDYWNNTSDYLKFTGLACGRGNDQSQAEKSAKHKAYGIVKALTKKFEKTYFTRALAKAGYRKNDAGFKCTSTANTARATIERNETEKRPEHQTATDPKLLKFLGHIFGDDVNTEMSETDDEAEEELQEIPPPRVVRDPNVATFIIHNRDRYRLGVGFYSQNRKNIAWPGGNRQYNLSGRDTYRLNCKRGENICFGAWRDHQTIYWGVGPGGRQSCKRCCITCGNTFETSLSDGGADSYPSSGPSAADIANIVNGVTSIITSIQSQPSYSVPSYSAPSPNRRPPRQSDVSGGN